MPVGHHGEALLGPARHVEQVREVEQSGALLAGQSMLACDRERLVHRLDAALEVALTAHRHAERVESARLGLAVAERAGDRERLARVALGLAEAGLQHALLRHRAEQRGALGALLVGLEQCERALEHLEGLVLAVQVPERVRERVQQPHVAELVARVLDELERAAQECLLADRVAGRVGGRRGPLEQLDAGRAREPLRVGDAVPELERALEQRLRLGERVDALGRRGGAHRGREGGRLVARRPSSDGRPARSRGRRCRRTRCAPRARARARRASRCARPAAGRRARPRAAARGGRRTGRPAARRRSGSPPPRAARRAARPARARRPRRAARGRRPAGRRASAAAPARSPTAAPRAASARRAASAAARHGRRAPPRGSPP